MMITLVTKSDGGTDVDAFNTFEEDSDNSVHDGDYGSC